ncbi:RagB/SusD family nutrient uptake outer membrane protein [Mariniflexile sp.]|uniref:RagB/SusD family nutrient uptake outer membrane protein n=1 Tax=Mariniflexile sp. TaxID=1979402 RepID=UPI00404736D4
MKNCIKKNKLLFFFSFLWLVGCSDTLDVENKNEISLDGFYETAANFDIGLTGSYSTLRAPIAYEWMLSEIRSDNTFMNNYGTSNAQNLQVLSNDVFEAPSFDLFIEQYWATTYQSIRSLNRLSDGLLTSYNPVAGTIDYSTPSIPLPLPDAQRKRISGEVSFMRAYHYFNLVRLYGGVFLIDKIITADEALLIPRSSVEDIYKFIIADLNNATANCKTTKFSTASGSAGAAGIGGTATKWAAEALLAKVYLTLGQKSEALPLLTDVIANSGHALVTAGTNPYADVFSAANEMNSEMVFAIRFKSGALGYGSSLSNLFSSQVDLKLTSQGLVYPTGTRGGFNNPTPELYDSYAPTDKRRDFTIKVFKPSGTAATPSKWTYWSGKHNIQVSVQNDSELDWPVLRFSDVLLMYCEADGTNNTTTLGYLNQVHTRAGLTALTSTDVNTPALYEKAVADERRWEFAIENQRWFDLLRFNKTMTTITAKGVMDNHFLLMDPFYVQFAAPYTTAQLQAKTADPKFDLLPIPNVEIVTNTVQVIPNNPGY